MICCTITRYEASSVIAVVQKLRAAGIPAQAAGTEIRLCQVWEGASEDTLVSGRCIGYGRLEWTEFAPTGDVEFRYYPPAEEPLYINPLRDDDDPDVIDVEAREIIDQPLLTNDKRP